ncbi:MAG: neutral/alkaline non-lysosomal ceramidase N-terminal domain-containing protein, partial [Anaeromyxobacteraceae bacterium]
MKKLPIRKLFAGLAIALSCGALAIGALSLPWHHGRPALPPVVLSASHGSGPLRAGAAAVNIDLPAGVPIGGFARLDFTAIGIRDPVSARAVYLEVPGCRVAVASAEILLVTEPLARRVGALVADLKLDAVLVAATHTHAGPGGYRDDLVWERTALGPFDPRVPDLLADRIAAAIRLAVSTAAPARVSV